MKKLNLIILSFALISGLKATTINLNITGLENQNLITELTDGDENNLLTISFEPQDFKTINVEEKNNCKRIIFKEGMESNIFYIPIPKNILIETLSVTSNGNYLTIDFATTEDKVYCAENSDDDNKECDCENEMECEA